MTGKTRIDVPIDLITGALYRDMLRWAQSVASHLVLVTYPARPLREAQMLSDLSPWAAGSKDATEWPGSRLGLGHVARLCTYDYDENVSEVILRYTESIADWGYPILPDDPHWLRADGTLIIGTTVHEDRLWLEVAASEESGLPWAFGRSD